MSNKLLKNWPYSELGFDSFPQTTKDIKRAYARKLKTIDQAQDIEGFQELRQAYQQALQSFECDLEEHANQQTPDDIDGTKPTKTEYIIDHDTPSNLNQNVTSLQNNSADQLDDAATKDAEIEDEIDWDSIQSLFDNLISEESQTDWNKSLNEVLSNPLIIDPDIMFAIESQLFDFLYENLTYIDDTDPSLPNWVTAQAVETLNRHFEWVDDYIYLTNRFWNAETMMLAMTARHKTLPMDQGGKKEPIFQNLGSLWGIKGLWILWYGTILLSLISPSNENVANTNFQISLMLTVLLVFYYVIKFSTKLFSIVSEKLSAFLDRQLKENKHASIFKDLIGVGLLIAFSISVVVILLLLIPR